MQLSIITINFNNVTGLKKTFDSVVKQTFTDYEHIVIDGGSRDGSAELIKENVDHISYWQSKKDYGIYDAMNQGIDIAKGDYIMFLNSGDYLLESDSLEKLFRVKLNVDVVYADAKRTNQTTKEIEVYKQPEKLTPLFFYRYSLCHQSMLFKRTLFEKYGKYREDLKVVSDWAYNIKLFLAKDITWKHVSIPIVYYDNSGLSSTNTDLLDKEREKVLRENFSESDLAKLDKQYNLRQSVLGKILINLHVINRW